MCLYWKNFNWNNEKLRRSQYAMNWKHFLSSFLLKCFFLSLKNRSKNYVIYHSSGSQSPDLLGAHGRKFYDHEHIWPWRANGILQVLFKKKKMRNSQNSLLCWTERNRNRHSWYSRQYPVLFPAIRRSPSGSWCPDAYTVRTWRQGGSNPRP